MMMPPMTLMKVMSRPPRHRRARTSRRRPWRRRRPIPPPAPPARLGDLLVDQAGGEVGVDRHLLAGHRIEGEARRHLRDASRTLGDDDEVHDDQDREDDDPDHEVAAHHEVAERLDDVPRRRRALVAVAEDQPRRGEVEGEPQHRRDEEQGREDREFKRIVDRKPGHHDEDREDDRNRQQQIEENRGQREDQHRQDAEHARGEEQVGALRQGVEIAAARQGELGEERRHVGLAPVGRRHRLAHPESPAPVRPAPGRPGKICRVDG